MPLITTSKSNQFFGFGRKHQVIEPKDQCGNCGKADSTKTCSRCHSVTYCCRECQVENWPEHKTVCGIIAVQKQAGEQKLAPHPPSKAEPSKQVAGGKAAFIKWNLFQKQQIESEDNTERTNSDGDSTSDSSSADNFMIIEEDFDFVSMDKFPAIYDSESKPLAMNIVLAKYRAVLSSCSATGWRLHLLDGPNGWMAPRMHRLLMYTATYLSSDRDFMVKECPHLKFGLFGFQFILKKISEIMEVSSHTPTAAFVIQYILDDTEWEYGGPAKEFFQRGGRVEHVLDYLCRAAKDFVEDGELTEILETEETKLPTTPLDYEFDLVRVMCMDRKCFSAKTNIRSKMVTMQDRLKKYSWQ